MRRALIALAVLSLPACDFPKDSADTLERVRGGVIRVGVADNPPWVRADDERPRGVEPALIEGWARSLNARVEWHRGSDSILAEALHRREIDVMAAGLEAKTALKKKLALTQPYLTAEIRLSLPPGGLDPGTLEGQRIAVPPGRLGLAAALRGEDAVPVPAGSDTAALPLAGYAFELPPGTLGKTAVGGGKRVLAVTQGENALLLDLDRYLQGLGEDGVLAVARREAAP